jgi:hypothetical protein
MADHHPSPPADQSDKLAWTIFFLAAGGAVVFVAAVFIFVLR